MHPASLPRRPPRPAARRACRAIAGAALFWLGAAAGVGAAPGEIARAEIGRAEMGRAEMGRAELGLAPDTAEAPASTISQMLRDNARRLEVRIFNTAEPRTVTVIRGSVREMSIPGLQWPQTLGSFAPAPMTLPASAGDLDRVALAVYGAESSYGMNPAMWRPNPQGPQGPMQVSYAAAVDVGGGNRFDPQQNLLLGRAYLAQMFQRYGNWPDAIAGYNWGPGNMDAWIAAGRPIDRLPAETAGYLHRVLRDSAMLATYPAASAIRAARAPSLPGGSASPSLIQLAAARQMPGRTGMETIAFSRLVEPAPAGPQRSRLQTGQPLQSRQAIGLALVLEWLDSKPDAAPRILDQRLSRELFLTGGCQRGEDRPDELSAFDWGPGMMDAWINAAQPTIPVMGKTADCQMRALRDSGLLPAAPERRTALDG